MTVVFPRQRVAERSLTRFAARRRKATRVSYARKARSLFPLGRKSCFAESAAPSRPCERQAGTSFRGFVHHRAPGHRARADQMVASLPALSPETMGGTTRCTC